MEISRGNDHKNLHKWNCNVTLPWKNRIKGSVSSSKIILHFSLFKIIRLFRLPASYLLHPWLTTPMFLWTSYFLPKMLTLKKDKTDLDAFLGPKMTPTTRMLNLKCSRETTTENFAGSKISQWQRQNSTNSCNWGISWFLQQIPTLSEDMDEKLKLAYKVVDVVNRANRKIHVTLLRYSVDKPENSYAQVRLFARKKEDEKFQQYFYANYNFEELTCLLNVMKFV